MKIIECQIDNFGKLSDIKFGSVTINFVYEKEGRRYYETNQFK